VWAQDANGRMQRCQGILTAFGQFDPMLLDATGMNDDVAGNRLMITPVDWPGDLRTAAIDGSEWFRGTVLARWFVHRFFLDFC